jgi:chemotaxis protein MotB
MILTVTLLASALGTVSCVSKSKHLEEVEQYETKIKAKDGEIQKRDEAIVKAEEQLKDLEQKLVATTKDRGQLKASLDDLSKAMEEMRLRREQEQKLIQEFKDLTAKFKTLTDSGALSVRISGGKMMVSLGSDILFPSGSAILSAEGKKTILEIAQRLNEIPEKSYQVEGHTDNLPIKTNIFPSNWELASARAISVLRNLIEGGLDAKRVSAASFGDTHPVAENDSVESRAKNRRIEIVVVPNLQNLPGYEELQKYTK